MKKQILFGLLLVSLVSVVNAQTGFGNPFCATVPNSYLFYDDADTYSQPTDVWSTLMGTNFTYNDTQYPPYDNNFILMRRGYQGIANSSVWNPVEYTMSSFVFMNNETKNVRDFYINIANSTNSSNIACRLYFDNTLDQIKFRNGTTLGWQEFGFTPTDNTWLNVSMGYNATTGICDYSLSDGSNSDSRSSPTEKGTGMPNILRIDYQGAQDASYIGAIDYLSVYPGLTCPAAGIPTVNVDNVDGDSSIPYFTAFNLPTINFTTTLNSFCRIANESLNYSQIGSGGDCGIGEGTSSHSCTLPVADALPFNTSHKVYLSCFNETGPVSNTASATLNITVDQVSPIIMVTNPLNSSYHENLLNISLVASCFDANIDTFNATVWGGTQQYFNFTNSTSGGGTWLTLNENIAIQGFDVGQYFINYTCSDLGTDITKQTNNFNLYNPFNFDFLVTETQETTHTYTFYNTTIDSGTLFWNNTAYNASAVSFSGGVNYTTTFNVPEVTGDVTQNISFYWAYQSAGSWFNSSVKEQTVNKFVLQFCGTGNQTIQFNIRNEDTPTSALVATVDVVVDYWTTDKSSSKNYSTQENGASTYQFCLDSGGQTVYSDWYVRYNTSNGYTHRYYLLNESLNYTSKTYTLFNFNNQTGKSEARLTLRDQNTYNFFNNIIAKLQRYYPSENVYRVVQMGESGDFGSVVFNVKENVEDYRMIFTDRDNNVLKVTDQLTFSCNLGICEYTVILDPYSAISATGDIVIDWYYNNQTKNLTGNWSELSGLPSTFSLLVTKETGSRTITICDETQTGSAGVFVCDLSSYTGTVLIKLIGEPNDELDIIWLTLNKVGFSTVIDDENGAFWTFGISLTTAMMGLISPVIAIIGLTVGLYISFLFGLFSGLTATFMIVVTVIAMFIGWRLKQ